MTEKSYVGMTQCWICNEGAEILLDRRMQNTLDRNLGSLPNIICSQCESQSKSNDAIWLISIRDDQEPTKEDGALWNPYRTGGCVLAKRDAVRKSFESIATPDTVEQTLKMVDDNIYFYVPDRIWNAIGLPEVESPTDE